MGTLLGSLSTVRVHLTRMRPCWHADIVRGGRRVTVLCVVLPCQFMGGVRADVEMRLVSFSLLNVGSQAEVKLCLHWPSDESGERKLAFNELSPSARDAVRKCSKSQACHHATPACNFFSLLQRGVLGQVAIVARLVRQGVKEPLYISRCASADRMIWCFMYDVHRVSYALRVSLQLRKLLSWKFGCKPACGRVLADRWRAS